MIRYVKQHFIDRRKYDHCVRMDKKGLVYGFSWYLDTVCEAWDALILDDYAAVWPLPVRRKWGVSYFYRPFGVQQLGIFSSGPLSDEVLLEFIVQMQQHCHYADVYLNEEQLPDIHHLRHTEASLNLNLVMPLNTTYRDIYSGYRTNTRRSIRKSAKHGLQLFEQDGPRALVNCFRNNKGGSLGLKEEFYLNMEKVMYRCLHNRTGRIWTVYAPNNSLVAAAFFVDTEARSTLLYSALTDKGRELNAMVFLLNEFFIYESGKEREFDFEGSNDPLLARFYKGFGSQERVYMGLQYNGLPLPLKWLKK